MLCSSFCAPPSLPPPSLLCFWLHSFPSKILVSGFFFFFFFFLKGMERPILLYPWHNKILRYRDRKRSLLPAPSRKSLHLSAGSCLNILGRCCVCVKCHWSFFFFLFFYKLEGALSLNRLQKELDLEPFKCGTSDTGLREKPVNLIIDCSSQTPRLTLDHIPESTSPALTWIGI